MGEPAQPEPAESRAAGARRRRRGLYGPPPRLTPGSLLTGRLLWHIGDWGRASEHIGNRWEAVAADSMLAHVPRGSELLVLGATPDLMAEVLGSGLPHADALRGWVHEDRLALEPLDFKWSLETAQVKQVSGETLTRLLELRLPHLDAALLTLRAQLGLPPDADVDARDGRFVAPEHPANRAALHDDPELPCLLLGVDALDFFRPLPGWPAARALARVEHRDIETVRGLDLLERYYRLGAGVAGALVRLETGLFDEAPAEIDAEATIQARHERDPHLTLNRLLLDVEHRLARRKRLDERLAMLPRTVYPFGRLRAELGRLGAPRSVLESRGALGRVYGELTRELAEAMRGEGQRLCAEGATAEQALDALAAETERWAALALERTRVLAERTWPVETARRRAAVARDRAEHAESTPPA